MGHYRISVLFITLGFDHGIFRFRCLNLICWFSRHFRLSHPIIFLHTILKGIFVYLLILRHILSTFRINIMSQHIMSIQVSTNNRLNISHAICVECRLSKICSKCRIWKPSCWSFEVLPCRIRLNLMLSWLCSLFYVFSVYSNFTLVMIFVLFICRWCSCMILCSNRNFIQRNGIQLGLRTC